MTIKHIVISGGGPTGFGMLGGMIELSQAKFYDIDNIKTIYATSVGAILGAIICLKYDWIDIEDYFVKRPWNQAINVDISDYFNINMNNGLLDSSIVFNGFRPLLEAKDLDINITLLQLFEYSKIELHCFATDFNAFKLADISYKTHPDLPFIKAVAMSCSLPILFKPIEYEGKMYIDGGLMDNFPIGECLKDNSCELDEILAVNAFNYNDKTVANLAKPNYEHMFTINESSTLFDYITNMISKMVKEFNKRNLLLLPNELCITHQNINFSNFYKIFISKEARMNLVTVGKNDAKIFLKYKRNNSGNVIKTVDDI
jgi:predicted acylesterase/phospholipase RssA